MGKWTLKRAHAAAGRLLGKDTSGRLTLSMAELQRLVDRKAAAQVARMKAAELELIESAGMADELELGPLLDLDAGADLSAYTEFDAAGFAAAYELELAELEQRGNESGLPTAWEVEQAVKAAALAYGRVNPEKLAGRLYGGSEDALEMLARACGGLGLEQLEYRCEWAVLDDGAVFDELNSLRQIPADASPHWRYRAGHALYCRKLKSHGYGAANRSYGRFADPPGADSVAHRLQRGQVNCKRLAWAAGGAS